MSSLYFRGKVVFISFHDGKGWRDRSLKIKVDNPTKRNGKWVFPPEARRIQRLIDTELALRRFGITPPKKLPKLSELRDEFLHDKGQMIAPATIAQYRLATQKLIDAVGDISVDALDEKRIASFRNSLLEEVKVNTAAKLIRHIHAMLTFGVKRHGLSKNVAHEYLITPELKPPIVYTVDELVAFFRVAQEKDPDLFRQCLFLLLTGFRSNESCQFKWSQIREGGIAYRNFKGTRDELMPMDDVLREFLASCPHEFDPFVFKYRDISKHNEAFSRVHAAAKLRPGLTIHSLKKTYANTLYDTAGDDLLSVQELAHHSSFQTTQAAYLERRRFGTKRGVLEGSRQKIEAVLKLQRRSEAS